MVRLTSAGPVAGARNRGVDQAERLALHDTVYGRVLRTKQTDVQQSGNDVCLVVPVTDWYGGQPRDRNTEHGADPDRVSPGD